MAKGMIFSWVKVGNVRKKMNKAKR